MGKTSDKRPGKPARKSKPVARRRPAKRAKSKLTSAEEFLAGIPKPVKTFEDYAREQGVKPYTGPENHPKLFESGEEAEAFMKWILERRAAEKMAARTSAEMIGTVIKSAEDLDALGALLPGDPDDLLEFITEQRAKWRKLDSPPAFETGE